MQCLARLSFPEVLTEGCDLAIECICTSSLHTHLPCLLLFTLHLCLLAPEDPPELRCPWTPSFVVCVPQEKSHSVACVE